MKKQLFRCICIVFILITAAFIFYNSAQTVEESKEASASIAETISPITKDEYETPADWRSFVAHVRKAAHAAEFFVVGAELFVLLFVLYRNRGVQAFWNVLSVSLAIAVADESIQIWSGRGPKVQDVLLDFCGAAAAAVVGLICYALVSILHRHICCRKQEKETTLE